MRARIVRPEFWGDSVVGKLPARTRLTYIGLWNIADDAGFFEEKVVEIAALLFPYESAKLREKALQQDLDRLADAGRIRRLDCGRHSLIPTLREWRIQGGTVNERSRKAHEACLTLRYRQVPTSTDDDRSESLSESLSESESPRGRANGLDEADEAFRAWKTLGETFGRRSS